MNRQEAIKICNDNGFEIIAFMCKTTTKLSEKTQISGVIVSIDEHTNKKLYVEQLVALVGKAK